MVTLHRFHQNGRNVWNLSSMISGENTQEKSEKIDEDDEHDNDDDLLLIFVLSRSHALPCKHDKVVFPRDKMFKVQ